MRCEQPWLFLLRFTYRYFCVRVILRPSGCFVSPHLTLRAIWVWDLCTKSSNLKALQLWRVANSLKTWKNSKGVFWYWSARPRAFVRFAQWLIRPCLQSLLIRVLHKITLKSRALASTRNSSTHHYVTKLGYRPTIDSWTVLVVW